MSYLFRQVYIPFWWFPFRRSLYHSSLMVLLVPPSKWLGCMKAEKNGHGASPQLHSCMIEPLGHHLSVIVLLGVVYLCFVLRW
ncbi:hypothetical protein BD779DRAFT_1560972 [Infundibulicybe gibba]|nr:hypothetical protein BD779DRAFT_1560972 [Infundibulicybe gibba]